MSGVDSNDSAEPAPDGDFSDWACLVPPGGSTAPFQVHAALAAPVPWWFDAVVYQVYPRSFADGDGDGIGDLPGLTARLEYVANLGVDAIWLCPFYRSPQVDGGYDVADHRDVDPLFGTLADVDALLTKAHGLGLRVLVDLVPNHSSSTHPWFQQALAAGPGSAARDRYLFRPGRGPGGNAPPNAWRSVFGGPAWTQVETGDAAVGSTGQWYLHLFDPAQPDFDWSRAEVRAEFEDIIRFWLNRGVDGFRVDVAHSLVKEAGLPEWDEETAMLRPGDSGYQGRRRAPMWDQDEVHDIYRGWRRLVDEVGSTRTIGLPEPILCAEAWVQPRSRAAFYVRPDEMHQSFNFHLLQTPWRAEAFRREIEASLQANDEVGATTTWVLSNHDAVRHATRLGYPPTSRRPNGIGPDDPQPDAPLGLRRARAATALLLALPGSMYLYQGEELGLPDHTTLPDECRTDPGWSRSGGRDAGRDGCRIPLPWESTLPSLGFSPAGRSWLPQPDSYRDLAVDRQQGVVGSTLETYRHLLALRRRLRLGAGSLSWVGRDPDVVSLLNESLERTPLAVVTNFGTAPVRLPRHWTVIGHSGTGPLESVREVPTDTTVWAIPPQA